MPKTWKSYERTMCEVLSDLFFGIKKPKGGRIDKDLPLCRADDSGAHPSAMRPGDVVPNGLWIRDGRFKHLEKFNLVIEVKYVQGIRFDLLLSGGGDFFKYWKQAVRQAESFPHGMPLLIVNKAHSSCNFVCTTQACILANLNIKYPINKIILTFNEYKIYMFTLDDFKDVNKVPPFQYMVKEQNV